MHFVGARKGAGMPEYPHHPFQRASVSPTESGAGIRVEETLVQAALAIQQLAAGTEERAGKFEGLGLDKDGMYFRAVAVIKPCIWIRLN